MFIKIPFSKEIDFKTNISEITKMSLEHDYNVNDNNVLGNFYISGEYRIHEVSINTDEFNYTLPFEVELREDINKDTLEFNIEDFSYDIKDNKILKVNIVYSLKAELNEIRTDFEEVNEEDIKEELEYIDDFLDKKANGKEEINEIEDKEEKSIVNESDSNKEERISEEEEKTIINTIKDSDDTFVTYHIHIVKENETLESICTKYNVSNTLISDYNNIDNITTGDKIIIPKIDE